MGHKAGQSFFDTKRSWSKRKDNLLKYYLTPYLRKIATLRAPICLVDAFAGPGRFRDGSAGSPLILCEAAKQVLGAAGSGRVHVDCVEPDMELHAQLLGALAPFPFATAHRQTFLEFLPGLEARAQTESVFLYADPFTVDGLEWAAMDRLFALVQAGRSVEVLLNLNSPAFVRRALACMSVEQRDGLDEEDESGPVDGDEGLATTESELNRIAGGTWWIEILRTSDSFPAKVEAFTSAYCTQLRTRFKEVCSYPLKAQPNHRVPKYALVLGSRSSDALVLINDAMVRSREAFARLAAPAQPTLFETRPRELIPYAGDADKLVSHHLVGQMARGLLIRAMIRASPGVFSESELRQAIQRGIDGGGILTSTGKKRINDQVLVWRIK